MKLKELKNGEFFTKKELPEPKENQVWIRGAYDRTEKRYECVNFSDMNKVCYIPGEKEVYTEFTF